MEAKSIDNTYAEPTILSAIRQGALAGFPLFLGYLPIAVTYGVLASQSGLSLLELTLMSVLVFAGAAQFMGANMIAGGALFLEVVIATFVLNFRHFVMSLSFMNKLQPLPFKWKFFMSFGLTDETFAVSTLNSSEAKKPYGHYYYATLILVSYFAWIGGSFLGGVLGEIIPNQLSQSMGIALYAMFIGLLIPSVKKEWRVGFIAIVSMLLNFALVNVNVSDGWAIVIATVVASFLGVFWLKEENKQ
ncbi:AzlC family ABC transporter permease [Salirhabdus salicampi]|uniref:AzlC family ABC transporter permease n=1 Tax=Salirhabdus salicampi TaxID=476102 RepID=UPI0020C413ED|nr:AzlC family ABC transporter permease [Salirhabdus salicampi]MCP8615476.1 AzlC family ABC transporter permease [Salirhabdus salicampi]